MKDATTFETETMVDLCIRQGRVAEGAAILRRLLETASDATTRTRLAQRLAGLRAAGPTSQATPSARTLDLAIPPVPGVALALRDGDVEITWALPLDITRPTLDVLIVLRGDTGVETVRREIPLDSASGRTSLAVAGAQTAAAAVGTRRDDGAFVPLARTRI